MAKFELIELSHIESCPDCGSRSIYISQTNKHCNGHWNESIQFECGGCISFMPNFMEIITNTKCPQSKSYKINLEKARVNFKKIEEAINKCNLDEKTRTRMLYEIDRMLDSKLNLPYS